jgi:hypothetical protein
MGNIEVNERDQRRITTIHLPVMVTVLALVEVNEEGEVVHTHFHGDQIGAYLPKRDGSPATNPGEALVPSEQVTNRIEAMAEGLIHHVIVAAADLLIKNMPNRAQEQAMIDKAARDAMEQEGVGRTEPGPFSQGPQPEGVATLVGSTFAAGDKE